MIKRLKGLGQEFGVKERRKDEESDLESGVMLRAGFCGYT